MQDGLEQTERTEASGEAPFYPQAQLRAAVAPVVVTGIGVLSCNGLGRRAYWDALQQGSSGVRKIQRFDVSPFPCQIGGELWDFNPEDFMRKSIVKHWHRHVHQGVAAARLAVGDAALASAKYHPDRVAVAMGTSVGSPDEAYRGHMQAFESGGFKKVSKFASSAFSAHSGTVHVSIDLGFRGPAITIASGCATGLDVLAWGCNQVRMGHVDAAVVGATESPLFLESLATACSLGIVSRQNDSPEKAMRPFDRFRDGLVLSEGACAFVLERADHARARGAPILAEIAGNGSAAEAMNPLILDKHGRALARAILSAACEAGVAPGDIDAIEAHGVSLEMYDHCESNAYRRALGPALSKTAVSAIKSMIGQSYSAGSLLAAAAGVMTLVENILPPTLNLDAPDPECLLDHVTGGARRCDARHVLVTAMSFGGTHSATLLRRAA